MNIKFPTFLATGVRHDILIKTVRGSHPKMRSLTTVIPREPVIYIVEIRIGQVNRAQRAAKMSRMSKPFF